MTAQIKNIKKGFTLIELLVVIGILAILLAITLIAINPAKQFGQSNDTKRTADVGAILNAIGQYQASNAGTLPGPAGALAACTLAAPCKISNLGGTTVEVDICTAATNGLVPATIAALPGDPTVGVLSPVSDCTTAYDTGYEVYVSTGDRVTVTSPDANTYGSGAITVTR